MTSRAILERVGHVTGSKNTASQILYKSDPKLNLTNVTHDFIAAHDLPPDFSHIALNHYAALAAWVHDQWGSGQARVFGINGAQGTGKSTLSAFLKTVLEVEYGLRVVVLSIDDFYLGADARQKLARQVHPLLVTRGVPGTHDVSLGIETIQRLLNLKADESLHPPKFIKALDDRAPPSDWPGEQGPVDLILFEGWCVASREQSQQSLTPAINELEANEDINGVWRKYVNQQLSTVYADWFSLIDRLIFLAAPDFEAIYKWRLAQEQQNAKGYLGAKNNLMDPEAIKRFIQHYERLTRANLEQLPKRADVAIQLNREHGIAKTTYSQHAE